MSAFGKIVMSNRSFDYNIEFKRALLPKKYAELVEKFDNCDVEKEWERLEEMKESVNYNWVKDWLTSNRDRLKRIVGEIKI